jgi:L-rhamnose mutarotase
VPQKARRGADEYPVKLRDRQGANRKLDEKKNCQLEKWWKTCEAVGKARKQQNGPVQNEVQKVMCKPFAASPGAI